MFFQFLMFESVTTSPVTVPEESFGKKLVVKSERRLLTLKLDVEMWRIMISEISPGDDPEKRR